MTPVVTISEVVYFLYSHQRPSSNTKRLRQFDGWVKKEEAEPSPFLTSAVTANAKPQTIAPISLDIADPLYKPKNRPNHLRDLHPLEVIMKTVVRFVWRSALFGVALACSTQEPDPPDPGVPKFPEEIRDALMYGEPQEVIVLLRNPGYTEPPAEDTSGVAISSRALLYQEIALRVRESLSSAQAEETYVYSHLPMLSLTLRDLSALESLDANPLVEQIFENLPHEASLTQSLGLIGQPAAAASGMTGTGTTVAVLDTGTDFTLPAFGSCASAGAPGCKVIIAQDFAPSDNLRDDSSRHGTNVSGIVLGVAPGAQIAALDVFRSDGLAYSNDIIAALNWAIQNKTLFNIAAVNLSLGGGSATSPCTNDAFASAIASVKSAGIVPVIASGNNGFTNAISSPACVPAAVSVGAVYDINMGAIGWSSCSDSATAADRVTCFSNSASFLSILAPGALITSAGITMGGTSQASPHVAGAMAVLKAAFPDKTPDQLLTLLQDTGVSVTDQRNGIVKKRIDLAAATSDCVTSVTPTTNALPSEGGNGNASITANASCAWTATSNASFVTLTGATSGTGNGTVTFSVSANPSVARTGTLTVARRGVAINQASGLDTIGPTGTVVINGGAEATNLASVNLAITASDPAGVATMCVSATASCTSFAAFAATKAFSLPAGTGLKTVNVFFKDSLGNTSASPASDTITLDTTKPTDGTLTATPSAGQVALSWSGFADANTGVASYKVVFAPTTAPASCTAGTAIFTGAGTNFTQTGLTNGTTFGYRVCALDAVGNVSTGATTTSRPATEFTPPTGSVVINNNEPFTKAVAVTLTLTGSDASGVSQVCISSAITCTAFVAFATTKTFSLTAGTGVKTVNVWFKDTQGNISTTPASDTITLDTTLPVDGALSATPGAGQVALSWAAASDANSGVAGYKLVFAISATAPANCSTGTVAFTGPGTSFTHTGLTNGSTYSYRLCALDVAGNLSAGKTLTTRPATEFVAPVGTVSINNGAEFTGITAVTLTLSASDASGVSQVCLSSTTTCTSFVAFATTKPFTLPTGGGVKTVNVFFKDGQGNISTTPASDSINVDVTRPTDGSFFVNASAGQAALSWTAASDVGSGFSAYKLVFNTGATAPASCTAGTAIYTGLDTSFTHTGLVTGTKYNYRLCAIDAVGNMSVGKTVSVTAP
jgi:hypothetical protein